MKPQRIQRRRTPRFNLKAISHQLNGLPVVYVGRGRGGYGKWGNPFDWRDGLEWGDEQWAKHHAVIFFRKWLVDTPEGRALIDAARQPYPAGLLGANVACWCKTFEPCHADALLEIANR